jgi:tetratricopeptide (TPR) repeat protein
VSEELEGAESAGAEPQFAGVAADPAAMALALGSASQQEADAFLCDQRGLISDQRHHLREQFRQLDEQLKQLRLGVWEKRLGVLLRAGTMVMGLAVAVGLAFMIWDASRSDGLLIEPFSVPPDLVNRGLTGEVIATKMLDRLVVMQAQTSSQRALKTYSNSWDEKGIKLDVPETGVSLAELDNFLREKLGHDTRVSGELVRTDSGIVLTARAGLGGAESISGSVSDLDQLIQQLAESVYRTTQPYRYAIYLSAHARIAEAMPIFKTLSVTGTGQDRPWGIIGSNIASYDDVGIDAALDLSRQAAAIAPDNIVVSWILAQNEMQRGLYEGSSRDFQRGLALPTRTAQESVRADLLPLIREADQAQFELLVGDFLDAAREQTDVIQGNLPGHYGMSADLARAQAGVHDLATARRTIADPFPETQISPGMSKISEIWARMSISSLAGEWARALAEEAAFEAVAQQYPGLRRVAPTMLVPIAAHSDAELGRFAAAERAIAATPGDCYPCVIARAQIAELQRQPARADWWFARAVNEGPSIPFAPYEWGLALLVRGHPDAAIEKFTIANQKGPHFADPLEGWGEALMAKNQSHLALAKFAEAEKYAPNWGRLHLKWGEALVYAGKRDEAKAQFARAAQLDLTISERSELAGMTRG